MFIQHFEDQKHDISTKFYHKRQQEAENEKLPSHERKESSDGWLSSVPLIYEVVYSGRLSFILYVVKAYMLTAVNWS